MAAMFISNIGRNAFFAGMAWIALVETNSLQAVALLLLVSSLAEFLSSGVSGYLADIFSKRRFALVSDIGRSAVLLATGLLEAAGLGVWVLFLSMAIYSAFDRGYLTAMQAMIPRLVGKDGVVAVNSASYLMMQSGNFVGALLVGWLLHTVPRGTALAMLSGIFVMSGVAILFHREAGYAGFQPLTEPAPSWRQAVAWRNVTEHRLLMVTICYSAILAVGVLINTLLSGYVLKELQGSSVLFGRLESGWALGSVAICLCLAIGIGAGLAGRGLLRHLAGSGLALLALLLLSHPILSFAMFVLLGAFYNACRVAVDVEIQRAVPLNLIGRAKGTVQTIATGFGLLIYALVAVVTEFVSASTVFGAYGLFIIVVSCVLALVIRRNPRDGCTEADIHVE